MSHPAAFADSDPAGHAVSGRGNVAWNDPARGLRFDAWLQSLQAEHGLLPHTLRRARGAWHANAP